MPSLGEWLSARIGRLGAKRSLAACALVVCIVYWSLSPAHAPTALALDDDGQSTGLAQVNLPRVDRSALDKLHLLEIHDGIDDDRDLPDPAPARHQGLDRPPLVAQIPEHEKPNPLAPVGGFAKVPADLLDRETCRAALGHGCQFLVPAWLGEQETKAQQHLYQLGLLALATNRTLVLPNVSKSRLGTCYRHPFSFYYSPDSLVALGIPTISQEDFLLWTLQRDPPPSAQVVSVVNAKPGVYPDGSIEIDSFGDAFAPPSKPNRNLCLRSPRSKLDFAAHSPLAIYPPEGYHKSEAGRLGFGQSVVSALASPELAARSSRRSGSKHYDYALPDVLAFNYEMRFPTLSPESVVAHLSALGPPSSSEEEEDPLPPATVPAPLAFAHFPYAEVWSDLADSISQRLAPFVAIHWRTETLAAANLAPCAESLLDKVFALHREYPEIQNVYLATDYPIEDLDPTFATAARSGRGGGGGGRGAPVAHSGTFAKVVTEQHHRVMKKFLAQFARRSNRLGTGLRLTTFAREQNDVSLDPATSRLPRAVLDHLVNLTRTDAPDAGDGNGSAEPLGLDLGAVDPGLLGILDKLVVTKAQLFLTGVPGVGSSTDGACAKLSSFTTQLIGAREALVLAQQQQQSHGDDDDDGEGRGRKAGQLWNTVQHWSLTGAAVD
ncbi:hypothetical protein JCM11491_003020 [Sporobolomyces phaffii]